MSHDPALIFIYLALAVFVAYIIALFVRSIRQTGGKR